MNTQLTEPDAKRPKVAEPPKKTMPVVTKSSKLSKLTSLSKKNKSWKAHLLMNEGRCASLVLISVLMHRKNCYLTPGPPYWLFLATTSHQSLLVEKSSAKCCETSLCHGPISPVGVWITDEATRNVDQSRSRCKPQCYASNELTTNWWLCILGLFKDTCFMN